jgi:hypothetical protein
MQYFLPFIWKGIESNYLSNLTNYLRYIPAIRYVFSRPLQSLNKAKQTFGEYVKHAHNNMSIFSLHDRKSIRVTEPV